MSYLVVLFFIAHAAGLLLPFCISAKPEIQNRVAHGFAALAGVAGTLLGLAGMLAPAPWTGSIETSVPLLTFAVRLDPLASLFVVMISLAGLAASVFALGYVTEFIGKSSIAVMGALYNGFLLSMTLVVMADHGFFFLIVWELMSLLSYFLVVTDHEKNEVRYAGLFYLVMAHVGTAFITLVFFILFQESGSFSFESFRDPQHSLPEGMRALAFLMALVGFGAKAGIVPLHVWLPYAHPAAPSHVSALMSGVMIKTAIYGLIRVYFDFFGAEFPWWWGFTVLVIGALSAVLGVMYALMEHDLKRLLAFHSVENIGIILLGIGAGMIFHTYGLKEFAALGLVAGLYHTINHAMFKALLFLGAGSLLYATHTRNLEEYGGLLRRMPWTGVLFLIGAVSLSALPPTNGFVSEWLVFQSLFLSLHLPSIFLKLMLPLAAALLALTSVLALACFAKAFGISFLALPRSSHARHAGEVPVSMRLGMGFLAVVCVMLGLLPMAVMPVLDRVASPLASVSIADKVVALNGWALAPVNVEFSSLSTPAIGLSVAALSLLALLVVKAFHGTVTARHGKTWGCGLNLSSRMEYTATGFAQPIKRVFGMIYQPSVKLETELLEESRYFAKRRRFEVHIEPVFQKYLYDPIVRFIAATANRMRVTQTGSLHLYLTYIFVTLVLLLLMVV